MLAASVSHSLSEAYRVRSSEGSGARQLKYQAPRQRNPEELERVLRAGDPGAVCEAMVDAVFYPGGRPKWVEQEVLKRLWDEHWAVRQVAATCVGHLARIERRLVLDDVVPRLRQLLEEGLPVQSALHDIEDFMPEEWKRFVEGQEP